MRVCERKGEKEKVKDKVLVCRYKLHGEFLACIIVNSIIERRNVKPKEKLYIKIK